MTASVAKRSGRGSKKGERRGGRKPGVPNKVTASVKQALTDAFTQIGGVPKLVEWGKEKPSEFYALWSKMLPKEITGADGGPLEVRGVVLLPALVGE